MLLKWNLDQWAIALALVELPSRTVEGAKSVQNRFRDRYGHDPDPNYQFMGAERRKDYPRAAMLFSALGANLKETDDNRRMVKANDAVTISGRHN